MVVVVVDASNALIVKANGTAEVMSVNRMTLNIANIGDIPDIDDLARTGTSMVGHTMD